MIRLLASTLTASVLVGAAACTDDDPDPAPTPTTTEPSTTATTAQPEPTDEEAIKQLIQDWFQQGRLVGIGEAGIDVAGRYLADPYLTEFENFVSQRDADDHLAGRLDDRSQIDVEAVEVENGTATSTHCVIDADILVSETSGEVVDDAVYVARVESTLLQGDDGWRITDRRTIERLEGEDACGG